MSTHDAAQPPAGSTTPGAPGTTTQVVLPGLVEPDGLQVVRVPTPHPGPGQVLVRTEAAGVSFAEQGMRRGRYPGQPPFPFVLGYDVVGEVAVAGEGVDPALVGQRVAAVTKTGAWASALLVDARDLVPVPRGLDAGEVEAVLVNGITAWQMLHRRARVRSGQVVLVHGASGGVGGVLSQLALHAGARVIGTASPRHHEALRALGVEPLDSQDADLVARVRELAPGGLDAVFDHLGEASARRSHRMLRRRGALVVYGTAADRDTSRSVLAVFVPLLALVLRWQLDPATHRASFYDFWGGHRLRPAAYRARQHADLGRVLDLLARGTITPHVAARFPLEQAGAALALAESRTVRGKVVLVP